MGVGTRQEHLPSGYVTSNLVQDTLEPIGLWIFIIVDYYYEKTKRARDGNHLLLIYVASARPEPDVLVGSQGRLGGGSWEDEGWRLEVRLRFKT